MGPSLQRPRKQAAVFEEGASVSGEYAESVCMHIVESPFGPALVGLIWANGEEGSSD